MKASTNVSKSTGSISRSRSLLNTVSSNVSRRSVRRLAQTVGPLFRAAEHPNRLALIFEKPAPHIPHRISPEKT